MTPRQIRTLDFIREALTETGVCPTYAEIATGIGLRSKSNAHQAVEALVRDGHLLRGERQSDRSLRLPGASLTGVQTPHLVAELRRRGVTLG